MGAIERLVPERKLFLDGAAAPADLATRISRITVDLHEDVFNECRLVFTDPDMKLINGKELTAGVAILVQFGWIGKLKPVFDGEIVSIEPRFTRDHPPSIVVRALERLHRLALAPKTRSYQDVDTKSIVSTIAKEHGLSGNGPAGSKGHLLQPNTTDFHLLRKIAARTGNRISIDGKKLVVGPPPNLGEIDVVPGDMLKRLKVRLTTTEQVPKVIVRGWDMKEKKEIVGQAQPQGELADGKNDAKSFARTDYFVEGPLVRDMKEAETIAKATVQRIAERFCIAEGEILGNNEVLPGKILAVDKIGELLEGKYRVIHARHEFDKTGYRVIFEATRTTKKKTALKFKAAPAPQKGAIDKAKDAKDADKKVKEKPNLDAAKRSAGASKRTAGDAKKGMGDLKKAADLLAKGDHAGAKSLLEGAKSLYTSIKAAVEEATAFAEKAKAEAEKAKPDLKAAYEMGKKGAEAAKKHAETISKSYNEVIRSLGSAIEEAKTR